MMEISLTQQLEWQVKGFWPWVPLKGVSMEIGDELLGVTDWLPATVPGGVHQDLYVAGLIDDPYADLNSLKCEWVENRWWVYRTTFSFPANRGVSLRLVCKGLDYEALVYLNGKLLGEHRGMYHPADFDVTAFAAEAGEAELLIVLKQAPDEMAQIGKTSETFTQKSRFNYKWDFSTRLVNVGIWDDVVLQVYGNAALNDVYLLTDVENDTGVIDISGDIRILAEEAAAADHYVRVRIADPAGLEVACWTSAPVQGKWSSSIRIGTPQLWFPNGYGQQPLYQVDVQLLDTQGMIVDDTSYQAGIRKLEYRQNEGSPDDALPYTFVVNGKRIYIKGANMTPLDHLYGNVTHERYDWIVYAAKTANLNMLRIWGGGIIEKPYFYELCDRHGIMVWQEFIQSSSGVDNIPSKRPEFLTLLEATATTALKGRRNHVSLSVWSGGNELMSEPNKPSTYKDDNLALLRELVEQHDPARLFLPTSASGPVQYITKEKGVSHDVHGHWKYQGNPHHYELYAESDNLFHSEFGVDALSSLKSLRKFVSEPHLMPTDMKRNAVWRHHGEWWDTFDREAEMFGAPKDLATFVDSSQWMQAEGLRFILEANRRRKFENSGSIVWQLNEPWPNVSCTNLLDYYQEAKMGYYGVKNAFEPYHASLDYRKLDYAGGERFEAPVYVHCSGEPDEYRIAVQLLDVSGTVHAEHVFEGSTILDRAVQAGVVAFDVPADWEGLFFVRLLLEGARSNDYIFSARKETVYEPALRIAKAELAIEAEGSWRAASSEIGKGTLVLERCYWITNAGKEAALHVYPEETSDRYWLLADDAYRTLFPGESMAVRLTCIVRPKGLFETRDPHDHGMYDPQIAFHAFGSKSN